MKTQEEDQTGVRLSALESEIERQRDEITNLRRKVRRLKNDVKQLERELEKRLPIVTFLDYVEDYFAPERNEDARVVKEVLHDLYEHPSEEERGRLREMGHKPMPAPGITVNGPLNDVHHNEYVKAGM